MYIVNFHFMPNKPYRGDYCKVYNSLPENVNELVESEMGKNEINYLVSIEVFYRGEFTDGVYQKIGEYNF